MGIRFRCPKGHKLHVKAFLAGKRGICPHCGEKFQIPLESDPELEKSAKRAADSVSTAPKAAEFSTTEPQTATEVASEQPVPQKSLSQKSAPQTQTTAPEQPVAEKPTAAAVVDLADLRLGSERPLVDLDATDRSPAPTKDARADAAPVSQPKPTSDAPGQGVDPIDEAPHAVWYVRPPSGGQFGPASGDVMRSWLTEGRVTADSLVWREGWPEWKQAGQLFPGVSNVKSNPSVSAVPQIVTSAAEGSSAELYRRRKSNKSTLMVVFMLLIACLILFGALVYVVRFMN